MTALLEAGNIVGGYGEARILHGISLQVATGEIVTLAGTNGSGKSTLLKALLGLLPRCEGEVLLNGKSIAGLATEDRIDAGLACVPQVANVFKTLTVHENLRIAAARADSSAIDEAYANFPALKPRQRQMAGTLSGGERQQLAFARALMARPCVMVLDEPTAALAPAMVQGIFDMIRSLPARGVGVLLVEQRARQALAISQRGYVLDQGKVVLEGDAAGLLANEDMARIYLGTAVHT